MKVKTTVKAGGTAGCWYNGKYYSNGAPIMFNGQTYTCVDGSWQR
jgi:hypothetical protein